MRIRRRDRSDAVVRMRKIRRGMRPVDFAWNEKYTDS